MDELEKVEKLREKANVTYEEAKNALQENNWDLLDAMVALEKQGKVKREGSESYSTHYEEPPKYEEDMTEEHRTTLGELLNRFADWVKKMVRKGNENYFEVERKGKTILSIPVTALVILLAFFWHVILVLMVIGLFTGFHYLFKGPAKSVADVNKALNSASDTAEDIKEGFKNSVNHNEQ